MALVDAAITWPNGKIYFFSGSSYFRYNITTEKMEDGPLPIAGNWPGLQDARIQGAIAWPNGKAYFFDRDRYWRFDIGANATDAGSPFPTAVNWKGILQGSNRDFAISAALLWPNGKAYLFQNDVYYAYDPNPLVDRVEAGFPHLTQADWPGLMSTGQEFTAAFVWPKPVEGRMKAYFFHRTLYHRYDIVDNRVDPGFPLPITGNWDGL
jgi:hypothetical protein